MSLGCVLTLTCSCVVSWVCLVQPLVLVRLLCCALSIMRAACVSGRSKPCAACAAADPETRRAIWEIILSEIKQGRSMMLTTHSLEEAETLVNRMAIMANGEACAWEATPLQELTRVRTYGWGRCHSLHWYPSALEEQVWQRYCVLGSCVTKKTPPLALTDLCCLLLVACCSVIHRFPLVVDLGGARAVRKRCSLCQGPHFSRRIAEQQRWLLSHVHDSSRRCGYRDCLPGDPFDVG